jgi:putative hydrolase of the HAD superfamily
VSNSDEPFPEWDAYTLWHDFIQANASDFTRALPDEYLAHLPRFLAELHRGIARKRLRLYPNVQETLEQLRERYAMAVVTDAQNVYAVPELHAVGLQDFFDPIIVSGNYGYRKPDPRLFYRALEALAVRPDQAVFVGNDLYRDIFGAQQVGMKAIFIPNQQDDALAQKIIPDYTISRFAELPQAISHFLALT